MAWLPFQKSKWVGGWMFKIFLGLLTAIKNKDIPTRTEKGKHTKCRTEGKLGTFENKEKTKNKEKGKREKKKEKRKININTNIKRREGKKMRD